MPVEGVPPEQWEKAVEAATKQAFWRFQASPPEHALESELALYRDDVAAIVSAAFPHLLEAEREKRKLQGPTCTRCGNSWAARQQAEVAMEAFRTDAVEQGKLKAAQALRADRAEATMREVAEELREDSSQPPWILALAGRLSPERRP